MTVSVAIDSGPLTSGHKIRGVGAYTRELINGFSKQAEKDVNISAVDFRKTNLTKFDVLHYPYFHPFLDNFPIKARTGQKIVITIHDLIQLLYPKVYQSGLRGNINYLKQKALAKSADAIIVPSVTSKKDVVRFFNIPSDKIHVIYEAPREIFKKILNKKTLKDIQKKYHLPQKFILYVGDVNYNKNVISLVKAANILQVPLVICGKQAVEIDNAGINLMNLSGIKDYFRFLFNIPHPELSHYSELDTLFSGNSNVVRLGFVPDNDLNVIFSLASVYCQPSFYEGFGLPVLEAYASHLPVVIAKTNSLVEVAGNASLVFDPYSVEDMANKISEILNNREIALKLANKGSEWVKEFSWQKAANETKEVYKSC
jgi:glycosyltransferase involved in cell wall biosynthesis